MPTWSTRSLLSLNSLPSSSVHSLIRTNPFQRLLFGHQQWHTVPVAFPRPFHQNNTHRKESLSFEFPRQAFPEKWEIRSATIRLTDGLQFPGAQDTSSGSTPFTNAENIIKDSLSFDRSLIGVGDQACNRILASFPLVSRIDLRIRFHGGDRSSLHIGAGPRNLLTFQVEDINRGEFRQYKHTSAWLLLREGIEPSFNTSPCTTIKTVYTYPRTSQGFIAPTVTADTSLQAKVFDIGVYRLHDRLFRSMISDSSFSFEKGTSITKIMNLAFETADEAPSPDKLEKISLSLNIRSSPKFGGVLERSEYESSKLLEKPTFRKISRCPRVYIALGSNMGDRCDWIEKACKEMTKDGIKVVRTSALYETEAMYVKEQNPFVNGVCEAETIFRSSVLLRKLKDIENRLCRQKTVDKGPRNIDLDILLYDGKVVNDTDLCIPHKSMLEREFVLRPLCDLIPNETLPPHNDTTTFKAHLGNLPRPPAPLSPLTPLAPSLPPITSLLPTRKTHLMAILNLTPDSFSDGGLHTPDPTSLIPTLQSFLSSDVTILDIGGQSTRPHAPQVSPTEELSRVLPAIKYIRSNPSFNSLALSIDTYRASVAAAAIEAGANIINDVSAGTMDPEMLPTVAKLGCTIILMHMRGTPDTMTTLTSYPSGIIHGVATELLARVRAAEDAGIFRWRIILDPGIGFAKTQAQNLELLRRFDELRDWEGLRGFPWCVGTSRKGFIGKITGVGQARQRVMGTAACVSAAVRGGADVVRVHDVKEMGEAVRMGDAIWRV